MMKNFVDGFFDVLSQRTVRYKGNERALKNQEKIIKCARNIGMAVIIAGIIVYGANMSWWIKVLNLSNYTGIKWFVLGVAISGVFYLWGKYEMNAILFLAETKTILLVTVINVIITLASYIIIVISPTIKWIVFQRIFNYWISSLIAIVVVCKKKKTIYSSIND